MGRFSKLELGQGTPASAAPPATHALRDSPGARPEEAHDARGFLRQGEDLLFRGRAEEALRRYGQALGLDSTLHEAWVGQIEALAAMGQVREAEVWATRALDQFPDDPTLLSLRGVLLAEQGQHRRALGTSDYALSKGHSLRAWIARGEILLAADNSNAMLCLDKAIEQVPADDWQSFTRIGLAYLRHRRHAKALEALQRACSLEPGRAQLWRHIASCQAGLGFVDSAAESTKRALELEPGDVPTEDMLRRLTGTGLLTRIWRRLRRR